MEPATFTRLEHPVV